MHDLSIYNYYIFIIILFWQFEEEAVEKLTISGDDLIEKDVVKAVNDVSLVHLWPVFLAQLCKVCMLSVILGCYFFLSLVMGPGNGQVINRGIVKTW